MQLAAGTRDAQHESGQAAAAAHVRERAVRGGIDRRQSVEGVEHMARSSLRRVADGSDADRRRAHELHEPCETLDAARA